MANSSILGAGRAPVQPAGRDVRSLGPSDTSDTGSDMQGVLDLGETDQDLADLHTRRSLSDDGALDERLGADSDGTGTGERGSAIQDEDWREGADIAPDRIVSSPNELLLGDDLKSLEDEHLVSRQPTNDQPGEDPKASPLDCAEWIETRDE